MVVIYLEPETGDYGILYHQGFFDEYSRSIFKKSEMRQAIESIVEWVGEKNEEWIDWKADSFQRNGLACGRIAAVLEISIPRLQIVIA